MLQTLKRNSKRVLHTDIVSLSLEPPKIRTSKGTVHNWMRKPCLWVFFKSFDFLATSYIVKWGTSWIVASNFLKNKDLSPSPPNGVISLDRHQTVRGLGSVFFIRPVKLFLWSCPTFDVFFVKSHSFSANLEEHALVLLLQLKGRIKEGLGVFFFQEWVGRSISKGTQRFSPFPILIFLSWFVSFLRKDVSCMPKCHLLQMQSASLKRLQGNFVICWSVWLTHSAARLLGP